MGKWTVQHTEDILLAKIRTAIHDAIELHRSEKRQEGEPRPVTFDEFVQQFDPKDSFTARLMEVLVKEYSERRAKSTPVDRLYQIATRTSLALGAMGREATVYDNCRPNRFGRNRNRYIPSFSQQIGAYRQNRVAAQDQAEDGASTTTRDEQFQTALDELEDGEFGAYWNSNLNDVYREELPTRWLRREHLRPILHDITMDIWPVSGENEEAGAAVASGSSSLASDAEGQLPAVLDTLPPSQSRLAMRSNASSSRFDPQRLSLVRRGSLRRHWSGRHRSPTERTIQQNRHPSFDDEPPSSFVRSVDIFTGFSLPPWSPRPDGWPTSSLEAPLQVDPSVERQTPRRRTVLSSYSSNPLRATRFNTSTTNVATEDQPAEADSATTQTRPQGVAFAPTDHDRPPPSIDSLTPPRWSLLDQAEFASRIWDAPWPGPREPPSTVPELISWSTISTRERAVTPVGRQNESMLGPQGVSEASRDSHPENGDSSTI